jgi:Zn-dependent alcohol dehydrogenase
MQREAKAVVCRQANNEVVVETVRVEAPRGREVMLKVAACGVCHSDLSVTNGTIPVRKMPVLPAKQALALRPGIANRQYLAGRKSAHAGFRRGTSQCVLDVSNEKLEMAHQFGATHTLNAAEQQNIVNAVKVLTSGGAPTTASSASAGAGLSPDTGVVCRQATQAG